MNFSFKRTDGDGIKHPISKRVNINGPNIRNKIYILRSILTKSLISIWFLLLFYLMTFDGTLTIVTF